MFAAYMQKKKSLTWQVQIWGTSHDRSTLAAVANGVKYNKMLLQIQNAMPRT